MQVSARAVRCHILPHHPEPHLEQNLQKRGDMLRESGKTSTDMSSFFAAKIFLLSNIYDPPLTSIYELVEESYPIYPSS